MKGAQIHKGSVFLPEIIANEIRKYLWNNGMVNRDKKTYTEEVKITQLICFRRVKQNGKFIFKGRLQEVSQRL